MNAQISERTQSVDEYEHSVISKHKELYNIVILAAKICDAEGAFIALADGDDLQIKVKFGPAFNELSPVFFKHSTGVSCIVTDAMNDCRFASELLIANETKIRFFAGFPLTADCGPISGSLCVIDREPKKLDERQKQLMQLLVRQVVQILELECNLNGLKKQSRKPANWKAIPKTTVNGSNISYLVLDRDLKIVAYNDEFSSFLKVIYDKFMAFDPGVSYYTGQPYIGEFTDACSKAMAGTTVQIEQQIEYQDRPIWCRLNFTPILDSGNDVAGVFFSGEDITKTVELRQKLFKQNKLLEKIIAIQSNELSGIVSSITELMKIFKSENYAVAKDDLLLMKEAVDRLDENIRLIVGHIV